jgi:hypothetical protein
MAASSLLEILVDQEHGMPFHASLCAPVALRPAASRQIGG